MSPKREKRAGPGSRPRRPYTTGALVLGLLGIACVLLTLGRRWLAPESPAASSFDGRSERIASAPQHPAIHPQGPSADSPSVDVSTLDLAGTVRSARGRSLRATVCAVSRQDSYNSVPRCVLTDAEGRFELGYVGPDVEAIVASAPAHLPGRSALGGGGGGGQSASPVTIILEPGGVEVFGRVLDAAGGPVPLATVMVRSGTARRVTTLVKSDSNGAFVARAAEGVVDVVALAEGYSQATHRVRAPARGVTLMLSPSAEIIGRVLDAETEESIPGVSVFARSLSGDVETRHEATSDAAGAFRVIGLSGPMSYEVTAISGQWRSDAAWVTLDVGRRSQPIVLRASRATTLTGTVVLSGQPCADALVTASGRVRTAAYAEANGSVRLDGLLPGRYQVRVYCPMALTHKEEVEVANDALTRDWHVDPGLAIQGRVESAGGRPVPDAVVSVNSVHGLGGGGVSCITGANGHFTCSGLSPGVYDCSVDQDRDPKREVVRVSLGEGAAEPVLLRTRPSGTIRVSVENYSGAPWPLRVLARGEAQLPIEAVPGRDSFVFKLLPLGNYEVYSDRGGAPQNVSVERDEQVVELELDVPSDALSIQGRALDEDGLPVIDAWVSLFPSDSTRTSRAPEAQALTDGQGNFAVHDLPQGTYVLHVRAATGVGEVRAVPAGSIGVVVLVQTQT